MQKPRVPKEKKPIITTKAPEVAALAQELIEKDHRDLLDLAGPGIKYGFIGEGKRQKRFGKAIKISEEARTLLERPGSQALVVVSPAHWKRYSDLERRQALDEILCSISFDGKILRIEKPDFKGYRANILRYGVESHEELAVAFKGCQLTLPDMTAAPEGTDPATGEIIPAAKAEALVPDPVHTKETKPEQKSRLKGRDGFGNKQEALAADKKRGATLNGKQVPAPPAS